MLAEPYPQILYWFAMPFTTPVPWEAVAYYDGEEGRDRFAEHPVGTGPFRLARLRQAVPHRARAQRELVRRAASGMASARARSTRPRASPRTRRRGASIRPTPGKPLPFLDRVEFSRERESIPRFTKFLQGYYDDGGIIKESFDAVVQDDRLSPEMAARGMRLDRAVEPASTTSASTWTTRSSALPAGERGRKLRQAMSLAIDTGEYLRHLPERPRRAGAVAAAARASSATTPTTRTRSASSTWRARSALLAEAGYRTASIPRPSAPLQLTFDTRRHDGAGAAAVQFFVDAWRQLGLDVEIAGTTYNQFQDKVRRGAYQIFMWGWVADYPDPENFLFLLECEQRALQERRAEHRQLLRPGLRPAVPRDEG